MKFIILPPLTIPFLAYAQLFRELGRGFNLLLCGARYFRYLLIALLPVYSSVLYSETIRRTPEAPMVLDLLFRFN